MKVMIIPSTRKRSGEYYFSAPNSPSNIAQFYDADFDNGGFSASAVPFGWEEKPGTPKSSVSNDDVEFAFDVGELESKRVSLSAEELFHGGVIKPLKPPPRLQRQPELTINEPTHKRTAQISLPPLLQTRKIIHGALSPRHKDRESADPFVIAAQNATKPAAGNHRGRERSLNLLKSSSSRKTARSLSPLRVSEYLWEDNEKLQPPEIERMSSQSSGCSKGHKKWRLKDFFLLRSASEGRAADKDKLKKYAAAFRRWSFRVTDSPGLGSGSMRNEPISVHQMNQSVSEDFKKKTFLSSKQRIVGALANGFGFSRK